MILGFELGFSELVGIDDSDTDELGTDEGFIAALAFSLAAIVVAPVAEEFFFRAFFYRALRNRLRVWSACLITSLVFASLHLQYVGHAAPLRDHRRLRASSLPRLRGHRHLFAVIAIHAIFNTLATAGTDAGWWCRSPSASRWWPPACWSRARSAPRPRPSPTALAR